MSVVNTVVDSIHGALGGPRQIWFRCTDSEGIDHIVGPVTTTDDSFDTEAHKSAVAAKVEASLANAEVDQILDGA